MTIALQWILGIALGLVLLKLLVIWLQPRLAFYPSPGPTPPPPGLEAFSVTTPDGVRLTGWRTSLSTPGPVLLYCCGNAGNLLDRTMLLGGIAGHGGEIVAFNYRGYGLSTGSPSEEGVYRDAETVYALMTGEWGIEASRIVLWGHSIGGAVAGHLASTQQASALILESTFRSARVMASRLMPLLPAGPFLTYKLNNESHVRALQIPILFIHGTADRVIPPADTQHLFELATGPKEIWLVEGAGHNDLSDVAGGLFYERVLDFARRSANTGGTH